MANIINAVWRKAQKDVKIKGVSNNSKTVNKENKIIF